MTFSPGTRLGPYEILAPLGAGGMGDARPVSAGITSEELVAPELLCKILAGEDIDPIVRGP